MLDAAGAIVDVTPFGAAQLGVKGSQDQKIRHIMNVDKIIGISGVLPRDPGGRLEKEPQQRHQEPQPRGLILSYPALDADQIHPAHRFMSRSIRRTLQSEHIHVITAVGQQRIEDADGLIAAVRSHAPNDKVKITYTRDGKTNTVEVTLASSTN